MTIEITTELVKSLVNTQFPEWSNLEVKPVEFSGNDNRTFHLGKEMTVRLPSAECYASAVEKEMKWLPIFKSQVTLPIPAPIANGKPTKEFPFSWSINKWIEGETIKHSNISDLNQFALDLANFLIELGKIDSTGGIPAGVQNFHRGGDLSVYDEETRHEIEHISDAYDKKLLLEMWELALETKYNRTPVWVHGDVAVGNLLAKNGKLCAVIDFGTSGVGDPSSDIVMAWTFFDKESRKVFLDTLNFDTDTINRGRGWALWKALITHDDWGRKVIDTIIEDYASLRSRSTCQ